MQEEKKIYFFYFLIPFGSPGPLGPAQKFIGSETRIKTTKWKNHLSSPAVGG